MLATNPDHPPSHAEPLSFCRSRRRPSTHELIDQSRFKQTFTTGLKAYKVSSSIFACGNPDMAIVFLLEFKLTLAYILGIGNIVYCGIRPQPLWRLPEACPTE